MPTHFYPVVVIALILVALAVFWVVGWSNGGDSGDDLKPPTLTPSPSTSSPG